MSAGKLPLNHQIVYQLQDILNLLPDISTDSFTDTLYVKTNDQMLVVYLASMVRSIVALHNLINNKITNRDAEEGVKKDDAKDKKDKDNKDIKDGGKDAKDGKDGKKADAAAADGKKADEKADKGKDEKKK